LNDLPKGAIVRSVVALTLVSLSVAAFELAAHYYVASHLGLLQDIYLDSVKSHFAGVVDWLLPTICSGIAIAVIGGRARWTPAVHLWWVLALSVGVTMLVKADRELFSARQMQIAGFHGLAVRDLIGTYIVTCIFAASVAFAKMLPSATALASTNELSFELPVEGSEVSGQTFARRMGRRTGSKTMTGKDQDGAELRIVFDERNHPIETRRRGTRPDGTAALLVVSRFYDHEGRPFLVSDEYEDGSPEEIHATMTLYDNEGRCSGTIRVRGKQICGHEKLAPADRGGKGVRMRRHKPEESRE
jgi:hypothetical protein